MRSDEEEVEKDEGSEDDSTLEEVKGGEDPGTRIGVRAMLSFQFSPPRFL